MGDAPNDEILSCPKCSYELGAMREDEGVCPECGLGYSKRAMRARRDAAVSVGLAMMGWGMVGAVGGELVMTGVGFLGSTPGAPGAQTASYFVFVVAAVVSAGGMAILARSTARSRWSKWWPVVIVLGFWLLNLLNLAFRGTFAGRSMSGWIGDSSIYWNLSRGSAISAWLLIGGAALVAARIAREVAGAGWVRVARVVAVLTLLGVALLLVRWWHWSAEMAATPPPGPMTAGAMRIQQQVRATSDAIVIAMEAVRSCAIFAVGTLTITMGAMWRAECSSRSRRVDGGL